MATVERDFRPAMKPAWTRLRSPARRAGMGDRQGLGELSNAGLGRRIARHEFAAEKAQHDAMLMMQPPFSASLSSYGVADASCASGQCRPVSKTSRSRCPADDAVTIDNDIKIFEAPGE